MGYLCLNDSKGYLGILLGLRSEDGGSVRGSVKPG